MAGLQRSAVSFRRSGSSGLVWDDKLVSGELVKLEKPHQDKDSAATATAGGGEGNSPRPEPLKIDRSRSNGGRGYRTGRAPPATAEPPSPKVSACGCNPFGKKKSNNTRRRRPKSGKRVM